MLSGRWFVMVSDLLNPTGHAAQHLDVFFHVFSLRFEAIAAAAVSRPLREYQTLQMCIVSWADEGNKS